MLAPVFRQPPSASTFRALDSDMLPHGTYLQSANLSTQNLNPLARNSQYALEQIQHPSIQPHHAYAADASSKTRHHPYSTGGLSTTSVDSKNNLSESCSKTINGSSTPVRRRISRACDQCNQLRTKCDGQSPCAHCVEFNLACEYARERKKRGKASRKELAQQQATAAGLSPTSPNEFSSDGLSPIQSSRAHGSGGGFMPFKETGSRPVSTPRSMSLGSSVSGSTGVLSNDGTIPRATHLGNQQEISSNGPVHVPHSQQPHQQMYLHSSNGSDNLLDSQNPRHGGGVAALAPVSLCSVQDYERLPPGLPGPTNKANEQTVENGSYQGSLSGNIGNANIVPYYETGPYAVLNAQSRQNLNGGLPSNSLSQSPMSGYVGGPSPGDSLGWQSTSPSSAADFHNQRQHHHHHHMNLAPSARYPVLQPLIPYIGSILPITLACDLLEFFFVGSSSAPNHPLSPYVLGLVFRKCSVLHPTRPRICSPALLSSMLWVAAQTSNAAFLSSPPAARGTICQKLMELTVGLLKPLIHTPLGSESSTSCKGSSSTTNSGVNIGGFGIPSPAASTGHSSIKPSENPVNLTGTLDDVATYINLATVISASEYKAASLRWWNAAWSLARELKLGRELYVSTSNKFGVEPPGYLNGSQFVHDRGAGLGLAANGMLPSADANYGLIASSEMPYSEEMREERRRTWWLLYIVDRHLALCYNRPLFLLDVECDSLTQPVDDNVWQAGDDYDATFSQYFANPEYAQYRRRGPTFECTGHSIFGYFLPLMTILGEIVDLNNARNHPKFGVGLRGADEWNDQAFGIAQQLENYGRSLREFEARWMPGSPERHHGNGCSSHSDASIPSARSANGSIHPMSESNIQTKVVVAYGTHVMHVLHVLLAGKWDPVSLLDENDHWTSSQAFVTATQHAISGAEAVSDILHYDPELSLMPFFFGIYLLQGSFLLLLTADKLQGEASPEVVKACETIVRAHEACVVTSNAEYQSNLRKVMRSALAQVRGLIPEDLGELRSRRREVLGLYRWTGGGSGLAV
ncbi:MAG: hypothetical protein M1812_000685 [Candelaria pacifica]|nr:MAG: hypothetical protein M1812_000685 [Candelaria pacifica]